MDRNAVNGILLGERRYNQLRNLVSLDDVDDVIHFTTWRAFDTQDPLDRAVELDSVLPLAIASGSID